VVVPGYPRGVLDLRLLVDDDHSVAGELGALERYEALVGAEQAGLNVIQVGLPVSSSE
jgi:hypothetical protein